MTAVVAEESIAHLDFDPGVPCSCLRQNAARPCENTAVTYAFLQLVPHGCASFERTITIWYYLCAEHREHVRNGTLKCGACLTPGAWVILKERPL